MTLGALDDVLRGAASVRISEIEWYGEVVVDLSRPEDRDRLRAAMAVDSLPGYVCACRGRIVFEFFSRPLADGHQTPATWSRRAGGCRPSTP
ncbi:hypothetical protein ACWEIJ_03240 [Lentzea sp. NPDC004789]